MELKKLTKKIYKEAGEEFNIGSPQQLGRSLRRCRCRKSEARGSRRPRPGTPRTVDVPEALKGVPIADMMLDYRQLTKLKNTYTRRPSRNG